VSLSSQHFHLGQEICLEIVAVKGISKRLTKLSDKILGIKGVIHGKLVMSKAE
jgi:CopG family nickel-responsive transcriptional regulator